MVCYARMAAGVARANNRGTFWPLYKHPDIGFQHQFIQVFSPSSIRACLVPRCSNGRRVPRRLGSRPLRPQQEAQGRPRRLHRATASSHAITPAQLHPNLLCPTSYHHAAAAPTSQGAVSQEGGHRQGASRYEDPAIQAQWLGRRSQYQPERRDQQRPLHHGGGEALLRGG